MVVPRDIVRYRGALNRCLHLSNNFFFPPKVLCAARVNRLDCTLLCSLCKRAILRSVTWDSCCCVSIQLCFDMPSDGDGLDAVGVPLVVSFPSACHSVHRRKIVGNSVCFRSHSVGRCVRVECHHHHHHHRSFFWLLNIRLNHPYKKHTFFLAPIILSFLFLHHAFSFIDTCVLCGDHFLASICNFLTRREGFVFGAYTIFE